MQIKDEEKCVMRVIEGSLIDKEIFEKFPSKVLQSLGDVNWGNLVEVTLPFGEIKSLQQKMVKHYEGPQPWYSDGNLVADPDTIICAFGADDGEGGRIFVFRRDDKLAFQQVVDYGVSKGIPREQLDFLL